MARSLETDSLSNQNISTALEIASYTAAATRLVFVRALVDQAAGNGDYTVYATLQVNGAGSAYRLIPITTAAAASGVTALGFVSLGVPVDSGDILKVYLLGLAGDTTTPDTRVDFYENDYLKPTTADRTLDVTATGAAGLDWGNVENPTTTVGLSGTTVKTATDIATDIDALPTAAENATALLDGANGIETSFTLRQAMRLMLAALAGKLSISGNTVTIRDVNDSTDRITATTDADGQRTAVTKDVT
jgi:hypothetical protein